MITVFFIPQLLLTLMCAAVIIGRLSLGEAMTAICAWGYGNFMLFIIAASLLSVICTAVFWKRYNLKSALAFIFASSQLTILLLYALYEILTVTWISGPVVGWFGITVLIIASAVSLSVILGYAVGIAIGIANCGKPQCSPTVLFAVGIAGCLMNIFIL